MKSENRSKEGNNEGWGRGKERLHGWYGQRRGNEDKEPQTGNNEVIVLARERERMDRPVGSRDDKLL